MHLLLGSLNDIIDRLAAILRLDGEAVLRAVLRVLGIWILAWLAWRAVRLTARRIEMTVDDGDDSVTTLREKRGRTISQLLRSVGRVVIITIAVLLTFNVFIDIAPILAGAGILGRRSRSGRRAWSGTCSPGSSSSSRINSLWET